MIDFPGATYIHRRIPKEAFYKHLPITASLKERFVSDVDRIFVENSLTKESLNLASDSDVKEILLLSLTLKKRDVDGKVMEAIARQNPHHIVFLLNYEDQRQLALYHSKLYRTDWMSEEEVFLQANGLSLSDIWNSFIEQIALCEEQADKANELSIEARLALQERILKLEKQIKKTEAAAWKEQQPKKRFALYSKLQTYKQELEVLKHGQT